MKYFILAWLLWPFLRIIRFASGRTSNKKLVIQTAKIGDWVNSTPLARALAPIDVVCSPVNVPLILRDECVARYYVLPGKCSLAYRLKLAWQVFKSSYDSVVILTPSMPNAFLARLACANEVKMLDVYRNRNKPLLRWVSAGFQRYRHERNQLALDSYLRLAGLALCSTSRRKHATRPLYIPEIRLVREQQAFRVGVSLSAGNALKTMPADNWVRLLHILKEVRSEVYVFGLEHERKYLNSIRSAMTPEDTPEIVDCLGLLPLEALPWHISKMHLYLSTDTGNSYIADSQDIPLINFAGPCCMEEQRPIGKRALVVVPEGLRPFSFVFEAPYDSEISPEKLYAISAGQWLLIREFIQDCRRAVPGDDSY